MKTTTHSLLVLAICLILIGVTPVAAAAPKSVIPTFTVISIIPDTSVTILTYNFPANKTFDVLMGSMDTHAVGGVWAGAVSTGSGGSFTSTFAIPAALRGQYQIAMRLQAKDSSGFYAYNWFYNKTAGSGGSGIYPIPGPVPTFTINSVARDVSVTITTHNFPANDKFDVFMGYMGTRAANGIWVDTVSTGAGGSLSLTFNIPAALYGQYQIAIRMQSASGSGYFAYNWFYNNTTGGSTGGGGIPPLPGYNGFPSFTIANVARDSTVTIVTYNLPPQDTFQVTMGSIGTRGIGGYIVDTINSGSGGSQTLTFTIPAQLFGSYQIAVRLQSSAGSGSYAYNWFYNTTTP